MNSRDKGKRGERDAAEKLREIGFPEARRGAQHRGGTDSPDILGTDPFHIEVKFTEKFRIYAAMTQAVEDAGQSGKIPVVMHRNKRGEWLLIFRADDLPKVLDPAP